MKRFLDAALMLVVGIVDTMAAAFCFLLFGSIAILLVGVSTVIWFICCTLSLYQNLTHKP